MTWWLGLRLLRGTGRAGFARLFLLVVGMAAATFFLVLAVMFPQVIAAREHRAGLRQPTGRAAGDPVGYATSFRRRADGQPINGYFVAPRVDAPTPPGVTDFPAIGEAVVSPALAVALAHEPAVRAAFPYPVASRIGPAGLASPTELFAWVRLPVDQLSDHLPFLGYGVNIPFLSDVAPTGIPILQGAFLGLVGAPLAIYFLVASRLSAATRRRRLAALRLVGLSARQTARVNAVEATVVAVIGGLMGLAAHAAVLPWLASHGAGGFAWFAADGRLGMAGSLLVLLAVVVVATVIARVGARRTIREAVRARQGVPGQSTHPVQLLPLAAGCALSVLLLVRATQMPTGVMFSGPLPLLMMATLVLTGLGAAYAVGWLAVRLAAVVGDRSRRLWLQLGARRLEFDPGSATRVVAGLVVVVFAGGLAAGLVRDTRATTLPSGRAEHYSLEARTVAAAARPRLLTIPAATASAVELRSTAAAVAGGSPAGGGAAAAGTVVAVFASCRTLAAIIEHPLPDCRDGTAFRLRTEEGAIPALRPGTTLEFPLAPTPNASVVDVTVPEPTLRLPTRGPLVAQLLVPADRLADAVPARATVLLVSPRTRTAINRVGAQVSRVAPTTDLVYVYDNLAGRRKAAVFAGLLTTAVVLGVTVGLTAFALASIDAAVERRGHVTALRIVGVSRVTLRWAQIAQAGVVLAVGMTLSLATAKLAEQLIVTAGGLDRTWTWTDVIWGAGAAVVGVVIAATATILGLPRHVDVRRIRRE